jgi:phage shock protein A
MTIEEQIERLTGIVNGLASAVAHGEHIEAHDRQIGGLLKAVEQLTAQVAATERQWQAYINTLPRQ